MSISYYFKSIRTGLRCLLIFLIVSMSGFVHGQERFQILNDGHEVLDTRTRLIWRRCPEGMVWQADQCSGEATFWMWYEVLPLAAQAAKATGKAWRVPNIKELYSIIDPGQTDMAIDLQVFPATPNSQFWTSSHYVQDAFFAWVVHFWYGSAYFTYLEDLSAVRLVRDVPQ